MQTGTRSSLHQEISELFAARLGLEVPSPQTDLFETGVLDSMAFVELLLHLENSFGIKVNLSEVEFEHFRSVEKIAEFVSAATAVTSER